MISERQGQTRTIILVTPLSQSKGFVFQLGRKEPFFPSAVTEEGGGGGGLGGGGVSTTQIANEEVQGL